MPVVSIPERHPKPSPAGALAYLPTSNVQEFSKGREIYAPGDGSGSLYMAIEGRVKVCRVNQSGVTVVVDIYQTGDFFGEVALLQAPHYGVSEQAVALEPTRVMTWSATDIDRLIEAEPRLAVALMQVMVRRSLDLKSRLESFSLENAARRLGRALMHFADRMGGATDTRAITIAPMTHELLAQYVGTSREIVSHQMSEFRNQGYIRYSRQGITIEDGLKSWLGGNEKHA